MRLAIEGLLRDEAGTAAAEYALLLSVLVIGTLTAWQALGDAIGNMIQASTDTIATGGTATPSNTP